MGILNHTGAYKSIQVRLEDEICFIKIYRPESNNTINRLLIDEFASVLESCKESAKIVVLEGLPEVFCFGADFKEIEQSLESGKPLHEDQDPQALYRLWLMLANGPYISIAHVQGKANAGGIGFVAACDIVVCEEKSVFSLSELLFGLMPACVLPFLIRRMGYSKANYMTLLTQPITAQQAKEWGLVDDYAENSQALLRKKLLRLKNLSKSGISSYKSYMGKLDSFLELSEPKAIRANLEVFSDQENLNKIARYVKTGAFPWEGG